MTQIDIKEKEKADQIRIENFVKKAEKVHNFKYNYSVTKYKGYRVKVDITVTTIEQRYSKGAMPYEYEVVSIVEDEAGFVWDLEKRLHSLMKDIRYVPKQNFGGYTECFKTIPASIIKLLSQFIQEEQIQLIA